MSIQGTNNSPCTSIFPVTMIPATSTPPTSALMPCCYTGGPLEYTMQRNNADWTLRVLPQMVEHMLATAPPGADTKSSRY